MTHLARLKAHGTTFEVVIKPEQALKFKQGKLGNVREALEAEHVFHDAKAGKRASDGQLDDAFGTTDELEAAAQIIKRGDVQLTSEIREQQRDQLRNRLLDLIHRNAVNPQNGNPHPRTRIENAFEEANVDIDYNKDADDQLDDVVSQIRHILPIKFEVKHIRVTLPAEYAAKVYGTVKQYDLIDEDWKDDGSWQGTIKIPGGMEADLYDKLNNATHGDVQTQVIKTR
jgi:ribosome maturation protein SDO1